VSFSVGVAHNPDSVTSVVGIFGTSWNNKRLAGVVFSFQIRKHFVETHRDVTSNILCKHPSWPALLYNSEHLRPEVTVILLASSESGIGKRLARISSGTEERLAKLSCVEVFDVSMNRNVWKILFQYLLSIRFIFNKLDGPESVPPCCQCKSADATKEI
tara:strand:+ start:498 stop:974 length:477 start_codon:yes stop_codon:yes gene_type:complete